MKEMNKGAKALITICVFVFVILFFLWWKNKDNKEIVDSDTACVNFNEVLKSRIPLYFEDGERLTEENKIVIKDINDIKNAGLLNSNDLSEVGESCEGNISAIKVDGEYYYSYSVTCGTCSTDTLYGNWSNWDEEVADNTKGDKQIEAAFLYNTSTGALAYTNWTDWVKSEDETTLPKGAPEGVETKLETETKIQYRYRNGQFKWYKLGSGTTYYNNKAKRETSPGTGYSKDSSTEEFSRTAGPYESLSALKSGLSKYSYGNIEPSEKESSTCEQYSYSNYTCTYTTTVPVYTCVSNATYTQSYDCSGDSSKTNCKSSSKVSSYNVYLKFCWFDSSATDITSCSGHWKEVQCTNMPGTTDTSYRKGMIKSCLQNKSAYGCTKGCDLSWSELEKGTFNGWGNANNITPTYSTEYTYNAVLRNQTSGTLSGYTCTSAGSSSSSSTKTVNSCGSECTSCTGIESSKKCSKYKTTTEYYADVYKYSWYTSSSTKDWCNNGSLSSNNPGGCIKDESTAKWGSYSEWSDKEVEKSETREVETRQMKRMRYSYPGGEYKFENWLTLVEFEEKMGKTIEEIEENNSKEENEKIDVQSKLFFRYRVKK